jgi:pimeloyl-ACP methyl ester carboxylesterase
MTREFTSARGLRVTSGGEGERLLVLLHGLGANSSVWRPFIALLEQQWKGRWLAPDFRGHGRSLYQGPYDFETHVADISAVIADEPAQNVTLFGHSFGGPVAALVASGAYGPQVRQVLAFGVKIDWTEAEIVKAREVAARPARDFATRDEAIDRYLKISGLHGLVEPASPEAVSGVIETADGFRVAMDPAAYGAVGPSIEDTLKRCRGPLRLAAGVHDPMTSLPAMQRVDPGAILIENAGHCVHVEAPARLWDFVEKAAL